MVGVLTPIPVATLILTPLHVATLIDMILTPLCVATLIGLLFVHVNVAPLKVSSRGTLGSRYGNTLSGPIVSCVQCVL